VAGEMYQRREVGAHILDEASSIFTVAGRGKGPDPISRK